MLIPAFKAAGARLKVVASNAGRAAPIPLQELLEVARVTIDAAGG